MAITLLLLALLMHLESVFVTDLEPLLFVNELVCGLIELEDVVAQVLRCSKLEHVRVESWHLRLDVVEEEGLHEVRAVYADLHLLEEL